MVESCQHRPATKKNRPWSSSNGGSYARADRNLSVNGNRLELVSSFNYLGVALTPKLSFTNHLEVEAAKAIAATSMIRNLFKIKIAPLVTYCLQPIASYLTLGNVRQLDRNKDKLVKRALGLPKNRTARPLLRCI